MQLCSLIKKMVEIGNIFLSLIQIYLNSYIGEIENVIDLAPSEKKDTLLNELSKLKYQREKLQEVMPEELTASDINVRLSLIHI